MAGAAVKLPLQEWISAFQFQGLINSEELGDGESLMTLVEREPRLVTVRHRGCSVLHLAVRHSWFGLVEKVLNVFDNVEKVEPSGHRPPSASVQGATVHDEDTGSGASSPAAEPEAESGDHQRKEGPALDMAVLKELLLAIEGEGEPSPNTYRYQSGLDVLAMAVMSGSKPVLALLAEAFMKVQLDPSNPYSGVITRFPVSGASVAAGTGSLPGISRPDGESGAKLLEIIVKSLEEEASHLLSDPTSDLDSLVPPGSWALDESEVGKLDVIKGILKAELEAKWELTSPFLPWEDFVFLKYCSTFYEFVDYRVLRKKMLELCAEKKTKGETDFMKYLLAINDGRGSVLHAAVRGGGVHSVVKLMPDGKQFSDCVNAIDSFGRTPLHMAMGVGYTGAVKILLTDERTDINAHFRLSKTARWNYGDYVYNIHYPLLADRNSYGPEEVDLSALDIVICSPHPREDGRKGCMESLLQKQDLDLHTPRLYRKPGEDETLDFMTPLQRAAYVGNSATLKLLANDDRVFDPARLNVSSRSPFQNYQRYSALHVAAMRGNLQAIRVILASKKFDPVVEDPRGNTALHLATSSSFPFQVPTPLDCFFEVPHKRIGISYKAKEALSVDELKNAERAAESRRQGCINSLLQAGIDIWSANENNEIADPGPDASPEYSSWWHEKLAKETQESKANLNAAANAISVTAALVATASYGGPLQPPMGYAGEPQALADKLQVDFPSVRIFIVCNTMAFYVALAAIMLSVIPSLPMPQESLLDELKLVRRTVTLAVAFLLLSVVAILLAFASASIAVIPDERSWNRGGLTVSTLVIGGVMCLLVLILCVIRLIRLAFHRSTPLRRLYQKYMCI